MPLYDFLAPAYDLVFESIYRPYRTQALSRLPEIKGGTILDLACGTGQNFPVLAEKFREWGKVIGVDISTGMLQRARRRVDRMGLTGFQLVEQDAATPLDSSAAPVDIVICTYGLTAMREWQSAFQNSWKWLKPGGTYLIHDIDGQRRNLHTWAVELATRCHFGDKVWEPLEHACVDFRMDYLDPSAHLFGGRLFVAYGTKAA